MASCCTTEDNQDRRNRKPLSQGRGSSTREILVGAMDAAISTATARDACRVLRSLWVCHTGSSVVVPLVERAVSARRPELQANKKADGPLSLFLSRYRSLLA
jgi:hypothetical protein